MDDKEERIEAADRIWRYFEMQSIEPPEPRSEEWREIFNSKLEQIRKGD